MPHQSHPSLDSSSSTNSLRLPSSHTVKSSPTERTRFLQPTKLSFARANPSASLLPRSILRQQQSTAATPLAEQERINSSLHLMLNMALSGDTTRTEDTVISHISHTPRSRTPQRSPMASTRVSPRSTTRTLETTRNEDVDERKPEIRDITIDLKGLNEEQALTKALMNVTSPVVTSRSRSNSQSTPHTSRSRPSTSSNTTLPSDPRTTRSASRTLFQFQFLFLNTQHTSSQHQHTDPHPDTYQQPSSPTHGFTLPSPNAYAGTESPLSPNHHHHAAPTRTFVPHPYMRTK